MKEIDRYHKKNIDSYIQFYNKQTKQSNMDILMSLNRETRIKPLHWAIKNTIGCLSPGASVLDIGCQHGKLSLILALLGYKVVATDIAKKYIEGSKKNTALVSNIDYHLIAVEDISQLNKKFDTIFCLSVMEHVANFQKAYGSIMSNLKDSNSIAAFIIPKEESWMSEEHTRVFYKNNLKSDFPDAIFIDEIPYSEKLGWYGVICQKKQ